MVVSWRSKSVVIWSPSCSDGGAQAQCVICRRMDVSAADGVPDPEQLEPAARVGADGLGPTAQQGVLVYLAEVRRGIDEVEVQFVVGQRSMFDDDLVHGAGKGCVRVLAVQVSDQSSVGAATHSA